MIRIKCLKYHNSSKQGIFFPGKKYDLDEEVAAGFLKDFPDKFEVAGKAGRQPKATKEPKPITSFVNT